MSKQKTLGFIIGVLPIIYLIFVYNSPDMLIPKGYELAIDGHVISKNILLFLICFLIVQLGFVLVKTHQKNNSK